MKCDALWFGRYQRFGGTDDSFRPANSDSMYLRNADKLKDVTLICYLLFVDIFLLLFNDDFISDCTTSKFKVIREYGRMYLCQSSRYHPERNL